MTAEEPSNNGKAGAPSAGPPSAHSPELASQRPPPYVINVEGHTITVTARPKWRDSEVTTKEVFESNSQEQVSFREGQQIAGRRKGSVRPDLYRDGRSVEVKNYLISTSAQRSRLVGIIAKQARDRARQLPPGTRQVVRLDLQGQFFDPTLITEIASAIERRSHGSVRRQDVQWIMSLYPVDE